MLKYSSYYRRELKRPWIWVAVILASAFVWIVGFYWAAQPPSKLTFEVWVGAEFTLDDKIVDKVEKICYDNGMEKCWVRNYDPSDYQYASAFAYQSRAVEVYVLKKDEALTTAQSGIFAALGEEYTSSFETLEYDGATIGVKYYGDFYILVNSTSKKSGDLLCAVVRELAAYGAAK